MCLAIPALITAIEGKEADVEIGGISRRISLMLTPEAKIGDYVLLHTGYAISIIDEEEAKEILIELYKGAVYSVTVEMDGAGNELFAGAGLAGDEHGGFGGCHLSHSLQKIGHRRTLPDNITPVKMLPQTLLKQAIFYLEPGVLHGSFDGDP